MRVFLHSSNQTEESFPFDFGGVILTRLGSYLKRIVYWSKPSAPPPPFESCVRSICTIDFSAKPENRTLGLNQHNTRRISDAARAEQQTNASATWTRIAVIFGVCAKSARSPGQLGKNVLVGRSAFMGTAAAADINSRCSCKGSTGFCRLD